jgi:hypothetical protein
MVKRKKPLLSFEGLYFTIKKKIAKAYQIAWGVLTFLKNTTQSPISLYNMPSGI